MPGFKQENARTRIKKITGEKFCTQALMQSGNIAYAWDEVGKTDCLSRD